MPRDLFADETATAQPRDLFASQPDGKVAADGPTPVPTVGSIVGDVAKNLTGGALQHLGNIGATLMASPEDLGVALGFRDKPKTLSTLVSGQSAPTPFEQRRSDILAGSQDLTGGDPNSLAWSTGGLATDLAGTAGIGGGVANAVKSVLPQVATRLPGLLSAIETSGMTTGTPAASGLLGTAANIGTRAAGGAIAGGAQTALVNPSDAGAGALVGGVAPPLLQGIGNATRAISSGVGNGVSAALTHGLGMSTGAGAEPISQAFQAGINGNTAFLDNMRGKVPVTDVLDQAKQGLANMRAAKSAAYRSGMVPIQNDQTVLSFNGIDNALQDAQNTTMFKGQVKNEAAANAVQKMSDMVNTWKTLDPAQFHTPEGLDALKQQLGGVLESIPYQERTARMAAGKVYSAVKSEIANQAPVYSDLMKNYSEASDQISEIERALSLGEKASADTGMRKLQSLMRNNVQTNYGNRLDLANQLQNNGNVDLLPSIAGQALSSVTPRGLAGHLGSGGAVIGALALHEPMMLASLPFQSPRTVGELAYAMGRARGLAGNATGRAGTALQNTLGARPSFSALTNPASVAQFGYRSAPLIATDR